MDARPEKETARGGETRADQIKFKQQPLLTEKRLTTQAKWSKAHPLERWAHRAFESALKRGLVHRQPCESCGAEKSEFHHFPDRYHEPLTGRHLCRTCHRGEHKRLRCEGGG